MTKDKDANKEGGGPKMIHPRFLISDIKRHGLDKRIPSILK